MQANGNFQSIMARVVFGQFLQGFFSIGISQDYFSVNIGLGFFQLTLAEDIFRLTSVRDFLLTTSNKIFYQHWPRLLFGQLVRDNFLLMSARVILPNDGQDYVFGRRWLRPFFIDIVKDIFR